MTSKVMRVRQLVRSLKAAPLSQAEQSYVKLLLNPAQVGLFFRLPIYEQRHALNVCRTLAASGFGPNLALLQAALLHDLGKLDLQTGRTIPIWAKCANVVLSAVGGPKLITRLASPNPKSWCYPFYLQIGHEERSAELAQAAGSAEEVIALLGQSKILLQANDNAAKALQWADDLN